MTNWTDADDVFAEDDYEPIDFDRDESARPRGPQSPSQVYSIRVPVDRLAELRAFADADGVPPTVMIRDWVLDRLDRELASRASDNEPSAASDNSVAATDTRERQQVSATWDPTESLAADALRSTRDALRRIAGRVRDEHAVNLAVVLFGVEAERAATTDPDRAAQDYGRAAALANRNARYVLAQAAWERSVACDPTNVRSLSGLGQLMHHRGDHRAAIDHLTNVASVDEYAELFLGESELRLGLDEKDEDLVSSGLSHYLNALRRWAYHPKPQDRSRWLRRVLQLNDVGRDFSAEVQQLIAFANQVAPWKDIQDADVARARDASSSATGHIDSPQTH